MLLTPKNGTACLTLTLVMGAMVMVHPTRITAYGSNTRVCREIAIALTMRVQLPSGRQSGNWDRFLGKFRVARHPSAIGKHERSKSVGMTLLRLGLDGAASCYG